MAGYCSYFIVILLDDNWICDFLTLFFCSSLMQRHSVSSRAMMLKRITSSRAQQCACARASECARWGFGGRGENSCNVTGGHNATGARGFSCLDHHSQCLRRMIERARTMRSFKPTNRRAQLEPSQNEHRIQLELLPLRGLFRDLRFGHRERLRARRAVR